MNEKEYAAAEGVRRSDLWLINDSPEKFRWRMENPETEQTPALLFGLAAHKILLEPMDFTNEFAVAPNVDKRTKEGKAAWTAFTESNAGKSVIESAVYDQIRAMADKAMATPMAVKLLNGRKEVPFFWTDNDTGVKCKVKLDCLTYLDDIPVVVDYKTCKSARTDEFMRDAYRYGYHVQAAMYTEGVMQCLKLTERPMFVFLVQEKDAPYSINLITVPEDTMNFGLDVFRGLLGTYAACEASGNFYGYMGFSGQPNELTVPEWMKKKGGSTDE